MCSCLLWLVIRRASCIFLVWDTWQICGSKGSPNGGSCETPCLWKCAKHRCDQMEFHARIRLNINPLSEPLVKYMPEQLELPLQQLFRHSAFEQPPSNSKTPGPKLLAETNLPIHCRNFMVFRLHNATKCHTSHWKNSVKQNFWPLRQILQCMDVHGILTIRTPEERWSNDPLETAAKRSGKGVYVHPFSKCLHSRKLLQSKIPVCSTSSLAWQRTKPCAWKGDGPVFEVECIFEIPKTIPVSFLLSY